MEPEKTLPLGTGPDSFYTRIDILKEIATWVQPFIQPSDTFVDFACGKNEFAPLLSCFTISYDICTAPKAIVQDWFSVKSLPFRPLIGLNPPFGYQGKLARRFVQHALLFGPKYLFLILPNGQWNFKDYQIVFQKDLPFDSFYNPVTGKVHREISTRFFIFHHEIDSFMENVSPLYPIRGRNKSLIGIKVTRLWNPSHQPCFIVLRRVGRNTTKQFYCITGSLPDHCCFIEGESIFHKRTWDSSERVHAVQSEYFLKIYFESDYTMDQLINFCKLIRDHPEPGYDRRHPHAITNRYVYQMLTQWLQQL